MITAIYQAISYLGFAAPVLLTLLDPTIGLLIAAALAALTMIWTAKK